MIPFGMVQDYVAREQNARENAEILGFDCCLAILCGLGEVELAKKAIEKAEDLSPGFKDRRSKMEAVADLSEWGLYE